jgi:hypothetical protein
MEPHWVQKVEAGEEEKIRTTLSKEDRKELVISDQMWEYYTVGSRLFKLKNIGRHFLNIQ